MAFQVLNQTTPCGPSANLLSQGNNEFDLVSHYWPSGTDLSSVQIHSGTQSPMRPPSTPSNLSPYPYEKKPFQVGVIRIKPKGTDLRSAQTCHGTLLRQPPPKPPRAAQAARKAQSCLQAIEDASARKLRFDIKACSRIKMERNSRATCVGTVPTATTRVSCRQLLCPAISLSSSHGSARCASRAVGKCNEHYSFEDLGRKSLTAPHCYSGCLSGHC